MKQSSSANSLLMSRTAILRAAFWAAAAFALVMASVPHPPQVPGAPSDKVQHIAAFLTLGLLAAAAYRNTPLIRIGFGLSLFGALIELVQAIPALHRDSDPLDWIADSAAAALILIVIGLLRERRGERRGKQIGEPG